jgi:Skp family chaperone for outer membrane proteins
MKSVMALAVAAAFGLAGPALAQGACVRPTAPAALDGATATMDQLKENQQATKTFIADSDLFQDCVIKDLTAQREAAKAAKKKLDKSVAETADAQISANQKDKAKAGEAFNNAVKAYKAAHPG